MKKAKTFLIILLAFVGLSLKSAYAQTHSFAEKKELMKKIKEKMASRSPAFFTGQRRDVFYFVRFSPKEYVYYFDIKEKKRFKKRTKMDYIEIHQNSTIKLISHLDSEAELQRIDSMLSVSPFTSFKNYENRARFVTEIERIMKLLRKNQKKTDSIEATSGTRVVIAYGGIDYFLMFNIGQKKIRESLGKLLMDTIPEEINSVSIELHHEDNRFRIIYSTTCSEIATISNLKNHVFKEYSLDEGTDFLKFFELAKKIIQGQ